MKLVTPAKRKRPKLKRSLLFLFFLPIVACRQEKAEPEAAGPHIRFAHLQDYAWQDRQQSGQPVDMKPQLEREALTQDLSQSPADVLVLRGLGSEASLLHLQTALTTAGNPYPGLVYVHGPTPYAGLGFLSKIPLSESRNLSQNIFRIKEKQYQPLAGAISISSPSFPRIWIWNQQAPSPDEAYERRRNETRLLCQALRPLLSNGDQVILSLHSREEFNSPMMRMIEELGLQHLQTQDAQGDSWTYRDPQGFLYYQDQWLFVSPALIEQSIRDPKIFDSSALRKAGAFRHQGLQLQ